MPPEIKEKELTQNEIKEENYISLQVCVCDEASKDDKIKGGVCTPENERFVCLFVLSPRWLNSSLYQTEIVSVLESSSLNQFCLSC